MTQEFGGPSRPEGFGQPYQGQPPRQSTRRQRKTVGLAAAVTAGLLVLGGGAYAGMKLMSHGAQPDTVVPGTATAFLRVDLDPTAGQKIAAFRLLDKLPQTKGTLNSGDPKKALFELLKKASPDLDGVDYDAEIAPWMGDRWALALVPGKDGKGVPMSAVAVKDEAKAREGMAKLAERARSTAKRVDAKAPGGLGVDTQEETVQVFRDGYLLSLPKSSEQEITQALAAGSLASKADYVADTTAIGDQGVASGWYDPRATEALLAKSSNASGSASNPLSDSPLSRAISEKSRPVALALRLAADHLEVVGNGKDGGMFPAGATVKDLASLPADSAAVVSVAGAGDALGSLWRPFMDTMQQAAPKFSDQLADLEESSGLTLPDDLQTLLGRQLDVVVPASTLERNGTPAVGLRIDTDTAKADAILAKIEKLMGGSKGAATLPRKVDGGRLLLGLSDGDVNRLAATGELGKDATLAAAVPGMSSARAVVYVDLDKIEGSYLDKVPGDYREAVRALRAVGYHVSVKDGREFDTLRLLVN